MSLITEEIRASATEFYIRNDICQEKSKFLFNINEPPKWSSPYARHVRMWLCKRHWLCLAQIREKNRAQI
ncbi:hypothetical protein RDI58_005120 [Solanum bulbocastanum]|uniref:Uncharacterized protein n=1 Tax=Solanum bulbocastanum TaxID=147425 RepID=A0AAN8TYU7_SOLBU